MRLGDIISVCGDDMIGTKILYPNHLTHLKEAILMTVEFAGCEDFDIIPMPKSLEQIEALNIQDYKWTPELLLNGKPNIYTIQFTKPNSTEIMIRGNINTNI